MELVEGPTLADRIAHGPMPMEEALPIAKQVAEALEAAHDQGHHSPRSETGQCEGHDADGTVKVLDFGLAKAFEPIGSLGSRIPVADDHRRSDDAGGRDSRHGGVYEPRAGARPGRRQAHRHLGIWVRAVQMLAGRRAFSGETVTETLAAVLERQPDWHALPASTPQGIRKLLDRCLQKEPKARLHDIADARLELDDAPRETTPGSKPFARPVAWLAVVLSCAASLGVGWLLGTRSDPEPADVTRWLLDVRPATALLGGSPVERSAFGRSRPSRLALALSPDGRSLAFTAQRDGMTRLYVRALDDEEARAIAGTEGADGPFFSPDGNWIGFWAAGAIRKVALAGGPPVKICDTDLPFGAAWPSDDTIVYTSATRTIWKVASAGSMPQQVTQRAEGEVRHVLPQILVGSAWLLYTVLPADSDWEHARVVAQSLKTGERKVVLEGAADARYVPSGHVVFMRRGTLMSAPFDVENARLTGSEVGLIDRVMQAIDSGSVGLDTGAGQ